MQDTLNSKVDNTKVLTPVPENALFTDTNTWRPISDSVSSVDSTVSASSKAVKIAYDKAMEAIRKAATVPSSIGGVGTYAFLAYYGSKTFSPGSTWVGSKLRYAGVSEYGSVKLENQSLSGTWRCMGYSTSNTPATLFLRIA